MQKTVTLVRRALTRLARDPQRPFLLFINLMEAHQAYRPPLRWRRFSRWHDRAWVAPQRFYRRQPGPDTQRLLETYRDLYDDEICYLDDVVQRVWQAHGLAPHRVRTFKLSRDKRFVEKWVDVVGLYLRPPENALVLSVDEKSQIQALDRTQPGLPLKKGRCGTMTHDYKRNGTEDRRRSTMRAIEAVETAQLKTRPKMKSGDTFRVHVKVREGDKERIQVFEGVVIGQHRGGARASFTVGEVSVGQGVERIFPLHSPTIDKIEVVRTARVRRAKLYYLRDLRGKAARMREQKKPVQA